MVVDAGPKLYFLNLDDFLVFAGLGGLLLLGEAKTPVIKNFADGGVELGAISTRSSPAASAMPSASGNWMTP